MKKILGFALAFLGMLPMAISQEMFFFPQRITGFESQEENPHQWVTELSVFNPTNSPVSMYTFFTDNRSNRLIQMVKSDGDFKTSMGIQTTLEPNELKSFELSNPSGQKDISVGTLAFFVSTSKKPGDPFPTPDVVVNVTVKRLDFSGNQKTKAVSEVVGALTNFNLGTQLKSNENICVSVHNPSYEKEVELVFTARGSSRSSQIVRKITLGMGQQAALSLYEIFGNPKLFLGRRVEVKASQPIFAAAFKVVTRKNGDYDFFSLPLVDNSPMTRQGGRSTPKRLKGGRYD